MTVTTFIAGFIYAFVSGWLMTLVIMAAIPTVAIAGYLHIKGIAGKDKLLQKAYAEAAGRAEQAIAAIKTVKQLNG